MSADNKNTAAAYRLGIDIGSTTVKIAVLNEELASQHGLLC